MLDQLLFFILLYCLMSIIAILVYGHDKTAAIKKRQRISEDTLHLIALLGGWPGALYAQRTYRHKTRKTAFRIVFWCTVILNIAGLIYSFTPSARAYISPLLATFI